MLDKNNEVLFGEYCKTCKYKNYSENDSPCAECLAEPVNLYSHKPVKWEGADGIYAGPPQRPDHAYQRAVKYIPENRKDREKAIARQNIDAEYSGNKTQTIDENVTDDQYPSATAVKKALDTKMPAEEANKAFEAAAQVLNTKIDIPDESCTCGDVLTVGEVNENGRPTKWKTAPVAAEQVQADWGENDETAASYVKNRPFGGSLAKVNVKVSGNIIYVTESNSPLWTFEIAGDTIYDVPNIETQINRALNKYGYTYREYSMTNSFSLTFAVNEDYPNLTVNSLVVYSRKVDKQIGAIYLPPARSNENPGVIYANELQTSLVSIDNTFECKLIPDAYTVKTANGDIDYPKLCVEKQIKTYEKFDFDADCLSGTTLFNYAYAKENGTAGEALGLTADDAPIYFYAYSLNYDRYPPSLSYYIESAAGRRFKAILKLKSTSWTSFEEISTSSGGSSVFYINITSSTDSNGNTTYSADKTADEIVAAYDSGALMVAIVDKVNRILQLSYYNRLNYTNRSYHILSFCGMTYGVNTDLMIAATIYTSGDKTNNVSINYNSDSLHAYLEVYTDNDGNRKIFETNVDTLNAAINGAYISIIDIDIDRVYAVNEVIYDDTDVKLIAVDHVDNKLIKITGNLNSSGDEENQYTYSEESLPSGGSAGEIDPKNIPDMYYEEAGNDVTGYSATFTATSDETTHDEVPFEVGQKWNVYKNGTDLYSENVEVQQTSDGTLYIGNYPSPAPYYITKTTIKILGAWKSNGNVSSLKITCTESAKKINTIPIKYLPNDVFTQKYAPARFGDGSMSVVEGDSTVAASGINSHAEGSNTTASGGYSHAEGSNTTASGGYSHAEGSNTTASGGYSHAEGSNTTASGDYSHAEGRDARAWGYYSHAEGNGTRAANNSQHVQGEYNVYEAISNPPQRGTYADIVGNGKSATSRSNAYTLDWNGNGWFAGDVYVGSTSGTNKDRGSKKLITASEVYDSLIIPSSTPNSTKKFKISVDDNGTISATELTE